MLVSEKLTAQSIQKGFTLVELMIAVSILGVLVALALPAYRDMIQNSMIRGTAESIQSGLQQARIEAIRRNARVQFVMPTATNSAWTIGCVTATADCPALITERKNSEGSSSAVTVTRTPAAATTVVFDGLGSVLASPPALTAPFTQLVVDNPNLAAADSRELRINLQSGGNVRICDPNLSSTGTDPRRC
jgi:type IV fimbrial biogenesis protein FimT